MFCHWRGSDKSCRHCTFFFHLDISTCDIVCVTCVCHSSCKLCVCACMHERERNSQREGNGTNAWDRMRERKGRERDTQGRTRDGQTETEGEMDRDGEKCQRRRQTQRKSKREWVREGERARKNMLGTYYATKCTRRCMEWNITHKVSPRLPFISSNHASHSIKQGHPQHTIKPHFHSVSISIVIFDTAHRATGSSSLVVYSKQYKISV